MRAAVSSHARSSGSPGASSPMRRVNCLRSSRSRSTLSSLPGGGALLPVHPARVFEIAQLAQALDVARAVAVTLAAALARQPPRVRGGRLAAEAAPRPDQQQIVERDAARFLEQAEGEEGGDLHLPQAQRAAPGRRHVGAHGDGDAGEHGGDPRPAVERASSLGDAHREGAPLAPGHLVAQREGLVGEGAVGEDALDPHVGDHPLREHPGQHDDREQEAEHQVEQVVAGVERAQADAHGDHQVGAADPGGLEGPAPAGRHRLHLGAGTFRSNSPTRCAASSRAKAPWVELLSSSR